MEEMGQLFKNLNEKQRGLIESLMQICYEWSESEEDIEFCDRAIEAFYGTWIGNIVKPEYREKYLQTTVTNIRNLCKLIDHLRREESDGGDTRGNETVH